MMVALEGPETETRWIVSEGKRHLDIRWFFISVSERCDQVGFLMRVSVIAEYISSSAGVMGRTGSVKPGGC